MSNCVNFSGISDSSIRRSLADKNVIIKKRYKFRQIQYNDNIKYTTSKLQLIDGRTLEYTHPEYYKQLINKDHNVFHTGQFEEEWKCEKCGTIFKDTPIHIMHFKKVLCKNCSIDKWSYPEKLMYHLLKQNEIDFVCHKKFSWSEGRFYDFYIKEYQCIIEVHGIQHYEDTSDWTDITLEEQQMIDSLKMENALNQKEIPIKHYIIIDARYSNIDWICNSIKESYLNNIVDLENTDWILIAKLICEDIYKPVIDLFNSGIHSKTELSKITHFSKDAVKDALYRNIKLLDYIQTKDDLKYFMSLSQPIEVIHNNLVIKRYKSIGECIKRSSYDLNIKLNKEIIRRICNNEIKFYKEYSFKYCTKQDYYKNIRGLNNG